MRQQIDIFMGIFMMGLLNAGRGRNKTTHLPDWERQDREG
jgi:hypothetical protein